MNFNLFKCLALAAILVSNVTIYPQKKAQNEFVIKETENFDLSSLVIATMQGSLGIYFLKQSHACFKIASEAKMLHEKITAAIIAEGATSYMAQPQRNALRNRRVALGLGAGAMVLGIFHIGSGIREYKRWYQDKKA